MGCMGRNVGRIDRMKDSSSALDSYGSLLSNAPSLAIIRVVLAMMQQERSASKTKTFRVKPIVKQRKSKGILQKYQRVIEGMPREDLGESDSSHFENFGFTC